MRPIWHGLAQRVSTGTQITRWHHWWNIREEGISAQLLPKLPYLPKPWCGDYRGKHKLTAALVALKSKESLEVLRCFKLETYRRLGVRANKGGSRRATEAEAEIMGERMREWIMLSNGSGRGWVNQVTVSEWMKKKQRKAHGIWFRKGYRKKNNIPSLLANRI